MKTTLGLVAAAAVADDLLSTITTPQYFRFKTRYDLEVDFFEENKKYHTFDYFQDYFNQDRKIHLIQGDSGEF